MVMADVKRSSFFVRWLDWVWGLGLILALVFVGHTYRLDMLCAQMGTDFRGYYAIAHSIWQEGFAAGYDAETQAEYQAALLQRCPVGTLQDPLPVSVPYLPAFVLLFLPLPLLEFSTSYLVWSVLNLTALSLYLVYFVHSYGERVKARRVAQFVICLPVIANLFLGQMNVWLVICLGEFARAWQHGQKMRGGAWLAMMLLKPHTLILLLPGLIVSQSWTVLLGFLAGMVLVVGVSLLLAGLPGLAGSWAVVGQFADPAFSTAPTMMNWRAVAYNLGTSLPGWAALGISIAGMALTVGLLFGIWRHSAQPASVSTPEGISYWIIVAYTATCAVTWHSHFYLWMPLLPFLLLLDARQKLPSPLLALWVFGPPVLYLAAYALLPEQSRNLLGLGMLGFNLIWMVWAGRRAVQREKWAGRD